MSPIVKKWLFVLFIAAPLIVYFLNLDIEALIHREIHGRRSTIYRLGVDNMFWFQFFMNILYAFIFTYLSVQIVSEKKEEKPNNNEKP
jgi:hypothetical protein